VNGFAMKIPALLISVSTQPKRATPSLMTRCAVAGSSDVARHRQDVVIVRRLDAACRRDDAIVKLAECLDGLCTNALDSAFLLFEPAILIYGNAKLVFIEFEFLP